MLVLRGGFPREDSVNDVHKRSPPSSPSTENALFQFVLYVWLRDIVHFCKCMCDIVMKMGMLSGNRSYIGKDF